MLRNEFSLGRMHTHNTQTLDMHTHTHTPVRVREKSLFHDYGKCYAKREWHCRMPKMPGVFLLLLCERQLHLFPHLFTHHSCWVGRCTAIPPSYFMPGPAGLLHSFRILAEKYLPYGGLPCWSHGLSSACMPAKPQCGTLEGRGLGTTPEFRTWAKLAQRWQVLVHCRPFARTIDRVRGCPH